MNPSISQIKIWQREQNKRGGAVGLAAALLIQEALHVDERIKWRTGNVHINNTFRGVKKWK